jgi:protein-disulfide isomerase
MLSRKTARKIFAAAALVFFSTLATLMCRQYDLAPARPSPEFRTFGPKNARIQIYEHTDFACPACRAAEPHVKAILKIYPESVRVSFKHYPLLTVHPWSLHAAAYADCAGAQGKFSEYADLLFENQEKWSQSKEEPAEFAEYAKALDLDLVAFRKCADDPATSRRVEMDISEGNLKGVDATPTFLINGKRAVGAQQMLDQVKLFDNFLKNQK